MGSVKGSLGRQLQSLARKLETEVHECASAVSLCQQMEEALRQARDTHTAEVAKLRSQLDTALRVRHAAEREVQAANASRAEEVARAKAAQTQAAQAEHDLQQQSDAVRQLQQQVQGMIAGHSEELRTLHNELQFAREANDALKRTISEQVMTLQGQLELRDARILELEEENDKMDTVLQVIQAQLGGTQLDPASGGAAVGAEAGYLFAEHDTGQSELSGSSDGQDMGNLEEHSIEAAPAPAPLWRSLLDLHGDFSLTALKESLALSRRSARASTSASASLAAPDAMVESSLQFPVPPEASAPSLASPLAKPAAVPVDLPPHGRSAQAAEAAAAEPEAGPGPGGENCGPRAWPFNLDSSFESVAEEAIAAPPRGAGGVSDGGGGLATAGGDWGSGSEGAFADEEFVSAAHRLGGKAVVSASMFPGSGRATAGNGMEAGTADDSSRSAMLAATGSAASGAQVKLCGGGLADVTPIPAGSGEDSAAHEPQRSIERAHRGFFEDSALAQEADNTGPATCGASYSGEAGASGSQGAATGQGLTDGAGQGAAVGSRTLTGDGASSGNAERGGAGTEFETLLTLDSLRRRMRELDAEQRRLQVLSRSLTASLPWRQGGPEADGQVPGAEAAGVQPQREEEVVVSTPEDVPLCVTVGEGKPAEEEVAGLGTRVTEQLGARGPLSGPEDGSAAEQRHSREPSLVKRGCGENRAVVLPQEAPSQARVLEQRQAARAAEQAQHSERGPRRHFRASTAAHSPGVSGVVTEGEAPAGDTDCGDSNVSGVSRVRRIAQLFNNTPAQPATSSASSATSSRRGSTSAIPRPESFSREASPIPGVPATLRMRAPSPSFSAGSASNAVASPSAEHATSTPTSNLRPSPTARHVPAPLFGPTGQSPAGPGLRNTAAAAVPQAPSPAAPHPALEASLSAPLGMSQPAPPASPWRGAPSPGPSPEPEDNAAGPVAVHWGRRAPVPGLRLENAAGHQPPLFESLDMCNLGSTRAALNTGRPSSGGGALTARHFSHSRTPSAAAAANAPAAASDADPGPHAPPNACGRSGVCTPGAGTGGAATPGSAAGATPKSCTSATSMGGCGDDDAMALHCDQELATTPAVMLLGPLEQLRGGGWGGAGGGGPVARKRGLVALEEDEEEARR